MEFSDEEERVPPSHVNPICFIDRRKLVFERVYSNETWPIGAHEVLHACRVGVMVIRCVGDEEDSVGV